MSIRLAFETHIQDLNEAKEEIQELAEQRNFQAFPDEQGISVMFCPLGIMEIQFEQEDGPQWKMEGECITTPAGPGLHKAAADVRLIAHLWDSVCSAGVFFILKGMTDLWMRCVV